MENVGLILEKHISAFFFLFFSYLNQDLNYITLYFSGSLNQNFSDMGQFLMPRKIKGLFLGRVF